MCIPTIKRLSLGGIAALALYGQFAQGAENLLRNPGFEHELAPAWQKRTPEDGKRRLHRVDTGAKSGKWSAVLENLEPAYTRLRQGHDRSIVIEPGSFIELSAWVKSCLSKDGAVTLQIYCMGDRGAIHAQPASPAICGPSDWQRARVRAIVPEGTTYCMAYLQAKHGVGKVLFDDVTLRVIRGPRPRRPAPKVALFTDLPKESPSLKELKTLFEDGLVRLPTRKDTQSLSSCVGAMVLFESSPVPQAVLHEVTQFARQGGRVFMDIRNFAQWQGTTAVIVDVSPRSSMATWQFDGPAGTYDVVVHYADESDGAGYITLYRGRTRLDSWALDHTPPGARDAACTRTISAVPLKSGDEVALRLQPHKGESCRVDAIELRGSGGRTRRVEAEAMRLGKGLEAESPALMFAKGIHACRGPGGLRMLTGLRVVRDSVVTAGFRPGQIMPRCAASGEGLFVLPAQFGKPGLEVLAVAPGREPGLVCMRVGAGTVVAADVLSLREPYCRNVDAYYKYSIVTNAVGNRVRFGEYYPRRLTYAEIVDAMKQVAAASDKVRFRDEGPASESYRICSLNLGREGAPLYLLYAAAHGSEWEPGYGLLTFAKRVAQGRMSDVVDLDKVEIKIVPILNPWGYDHRRRQNAHGVDLNRQGDFRWHEFKGRDSNKDGVWGPGDYDWKGAGPFCEPESKTYQTMCATPNLHCILDFHGNTSAANNKVSILPATGHPDNEVRGYTMQQIANERLRGRHLLRQSDEDACSQYVLTRVSVGAPYPYLMNTAGRGKFGTLIELTAGYPSTHGTVLQTDVVCELCRALFMAYGPSGRDR